MGYQVPDVNNCYDFTCILGQLNQWCCVNAPLVQSVYDQCKATSLSEQVSWLFGVVRDTVKAQQCVDNNFKILYDFVKDFFANLDLQSEVNEWLENAYSDGRLNNMINSLVLSITPPVIVESTSEMTDERRIYVLKSDGHIYYYDDGWKDSLLVYGNNIGNVTTYIGYYDNNSDLNMLPTNTIYTLRPYSTGLYVNYPEQMKNFSMSATIYTIGDENITLQYIMFEQGMMALRYKIDKYNKWTYSNNYIGSPNVNTDLNDLTTGIYQLTTYTSGKYLNYPEQLQSLGVISTLFVNIIVVGSQILIDERGDLLIRFKLSSGSFSKWRTLNSLPSDNTPLNLNNAYAEVKNPFSTIKDFSVTGATVKIFNNIPYIMQTKQLLNNPYFSIIDDDTTSLALVNQFFTLCNNKNIIGNYSVIMSRDDEILERLLEIENYGFNMVYHCNVQSQIYNQERTQNVINDFVTGYKKLISKGFIDTKLWATPYGSSVKSILELAPMFGFNGAFTTGTSTPCLVNGREYAINRINIGPWETNGDYKDLEWHKNVIDTYKNSNCWFVYTTHVNAWGDKVNEITALFNSVIDYLTESGVRNINACGGFNIYKHFMNRNVFS